jgi:hypothetical protein
MPTYWLESAGGWSQIDREGYDTIANAARACTSAHDYIQLPMVVKADFAFQLPLGVKMPVSRSIQ